MMHMALLEHVCIICDALLSQGDRFGSGFDPKTWKRYNSKT